ncbi:MAG: LptF/LptG family permease [Saprospiraceae bacterium]|nr:LptF/LptG family permease [Saprospiraceae bacterium]
MFSTIIAKYLKILDRYIIKKYLTTFGFVLLILSLIACVIDLGEKIEDFKHEHVPVKTVLFDYYLNFIPHINALLFPLIALISVVFFTSRMAYDSEIISILNAGVSFQRVMRPYLVAAGIIGIVHLAFNHYIVPNGNKKRLAVERKHVWKNNDKGKFDNVHMLLDPKTAVFVGYYNKHDSTTRDFRIEKYDTAGNIVYLIKAETANFKTNPNRWELRQLSRRTFSGLYERLETNISTLDTVLNLAPEDFSQYLNQNELLTTGELSYEIYKRESRGIGNFKPFEIEMHRRTADAFTIVILTLIGMSIAARKVRGGMGFHLALGIGIGALYIVVSKFSATFAQQPDVPTWLGVWIPNFIFGAVALFLISKAQK